MRKSGKYELVPNLTSVEKEKERIKTRNDLYQREKELRRINLSVAPDAQDPIEYKGAVVPRYLAREIENTKHVINAERRRVRYKLYPGWDEMTPFEQAKHEVDGNIGDLEGDYSTPDDFDDVKDQQYSEKEFNYVTNYTSVWHEYCLIRKYEQQVVDDILWLYENRPGAITEILAKGYIQAQVEYIYVDSADMTDSYIRHHNIVDFWQDMRENYA